MIKGVDAGVGMTCSCNYTRTQGTVVYLMPVVVKALDLVSIATKIITKLMSINSKWASIVGVSDGGSCFMNFDTDPDPDPDPRIRSPIRMN